MNAQPASTSPEDGTAQARPVTRARGGKYLAFNLGKQLFGVEILRVREIVCGPVITPVPRAPYRKCSRCPTLTSSPRPTWAARTRTPSGGSRR
jgi:hypothetical protein